MSHCIVDEFGCKRRIFMLHSYYFPVKILLSELRIVRYSLRYNIIALLSLRPIKKLLTWDNHLTFVYLYLYQMPHS